MQKYTTIIGVLKMKGDGFTYEDIQSRFGIGSSTVNRTLSTMRKLGLTYEELSKKSPDEVEQLFYPSVFGQYSLNIIIVKKRIKL